MRSHSPKESNRLLKNGRLRRLSFPVSSTGQSCCSVPVGNGLKPFPTKDCLLARSPALRGEGRAIFEQPEKDDFPDMQLAPFIFFPELFEDLWNEEGKDKEAYGEENLEGK
jgi:hypothetical protein